MSIMGLLDIGKTGLIVANSALTTVAHNTANVDTPGYTRQIVVLQNNPTDSKVVSGTTGTGVSLVDVQRMYDSFTTFQIRTEDANKSYWDAYQQGAQQIDDVFNEAADGSLGSSMQDFFSSWQELAQNPSGYAERSSLLNKSDYFSSRVGTAYTTLENERSQIYQNTGVSVQQVNSLTSEIATVNVQIAQSPGSLDLLDQRDQMIENLNKLVGVSTYSDQSGNYSVLVGGKPLVSGGSSYNMTVQTDDKNNMRFYLDNSNNKQDITDSIGSGQLKAGIDLRDKQMTGIMNQMNAFAIDLTDAVNYYQKQGYGADGTTGNNFFNSLLAVNKAVNLNGNGTVSSVRITDVNAADPKNYYRIDYIDNTAYAALDPGPDPQGVATDQTDYQQDGSTGLYWRVQQSTDGLSWTTLDPSKVSITTDTTVKDETIKVSDSNNVLEVDEGTGPVDLTIPNGTYTHEQLAANLQTQLNNISGNSYAVSWDSAAQKFTFDNTNGLNDLTLNLDASSAAKILGFDPAVNPTITVAQGDTQQSDYSLVSNKRNVEFSGISVGIDGDQADMFSGAVTNTFDIKLQENAAREMKVSLTDPLKIAAAGGNNVTISGSNNSISFTENANPAAVPPATTAPAPTYLTAVIPSGTYSRAQLASEVQAALEAASTAAGSNNGAGFKYTVSYDASKKTYSIYNDTYVPQTDPTTGLTNPDYPHDVLIDWSSSASTAKGVLGFNSNSSISPPPSTPLPVFPTRASPYRRSAMLRFIPSCLGTTVMPL